MPDQQRALTHPCGVNYNALPRFSPDGHTLASIRSAPAGAGDIYTVPVAGGEPKRLTFDKVSTPGLDWTPDGAYIVFSSERGGDQSLWKVPASGGEPERLPVGQGRSAALSFP
jgi:Tol biopolymer transport system component